MPRLLLAALLLAGAAGSATPGWLANAAGSYSGLVRNEGRLECHHTVLALQDGQLTGHYWIDADDPFEGELTHFNEVGDTSGQFTWTDRYGSGVMLLFFDAASTSTAPTGFHGFWGIDAPSPANVIAAQRGDACAAAISLRTPTPTPSHATLPHGLASPATG